MCVCRKPRQKLRMGHAPIVRFCDCLNSPKLLRKRGNAVLLVGLTLSALILRSVVGLVLMKWVVMALIRPLRAGQQAGPVVAHLNSA